MNIVKPKGALFAIHIGASFYLFSYLILVYFCFVSCKQDKVDTRCLELVRDVEEKQKELPMDMAEGVTVTRIEYKDSLYSIWWEIDENINSFDEYVKIKKEFKENMLLDIKSSKGKEREQYGTFEEYGVSIEYHFVGKQSYREVLILIRHEEIEEVLHAKEEDNAYEILQQAIDIKKASLPKYISEECYITDISLIDSMVNICVAIDESHIRSIGMLKTISENEIDTRYRIIDYVWENKSATYFMLQIAEAQCGVVYHFKGSETDTTYNIDFKPSAIQLQSISYREQMLR